MLHRQLCNSFIFKNEITPMVLTNTNKTMSTYIFRFIQDDTVLYIVLNQVFRVHIQTGFKYLMKYYLRRRSYFHVESLTHRQLAGSWIDPLEQVTFLH